VTLVLAAAGGSAMQVLELALRQVSGKPTGQRSCLLAFCYGRKFISG